MRRSLRKGIGCLSLACAATTAARGEVTPAALFSDHMVLQSGMDVPVWGTAAAGERVMVTLNPQRQVATASADGRWMVRLKKLKPGGPFEMTIAGTNRIVIHDVLIGEVWLGSGQSNMAFTVSKKIASYAGVINEDQEIAAADQKFVASDATIESDVVIVRSPSVGAPVAVRYAWENYPDGCNLYNGAGLPAAPFRTDRW